jgi:hypothetical protein
MIKTNIEETATEFNEQQPSIENTIEKELHNSINFLNLSVDRKEKDNNLRHTENSLKQIS